MNTLRLLLAALLVAVFGLNAKAQGFKMVIDGQAIEIGEGDEIVLSEGNEDKGTATVSVTKNGETQTFECSQFQFNGAIEAYYMDMIASLTTPWSQNGRADDFGYGSILVQRDAMTADVVRENIGYNWFSTVYENDMQPNYAATHIHGFFFPKVIGRCNQLLQALEAIQNPDQTQQQYMGYAYAMRAWAYLDWARTYEFLPNDATKPIGAFGKNIEGLTVPIFTEPYDGDFSALDTQLRCDKPRATHQDMSAFIQSDLQKAAQLLNGASVEDKRLPSLAVVDGLLARLYMWDGRYDQAAEAAARAISEHGQRPLSRDEFLDIEHGFNTLTTPAWMWGAKPADNQIYSYASWGSWMSMEAQGYTEVVPVRIPRSLYYSIPDTDVRKQLFLFTTQEPFRPGLSNYGPPSFSALKFHSAGEVGDINTVGAVDLPLMRLEEIMLIQAEAAAQQGNLEQAASLLNNLIQTRNPNYVCQATTQQEMIDEIFYQKRIELWGEGQIFFDYKRLNKPVQRSVNDGWSSSFALNTTTRPAWMNLPFPGTIQDFFTALGGEKNPSPTGLYNQEGVSGAVQADSIAFLTFPCLHELVGDPNPLSINVVTFKLYQSETGNVISIKIPAREMIPHTQDIELTGTEENYLNIELLSDSECRIPAQFTGLIYKGEPLIIRSSQNGRVENGSITFPNHSIVLEWGRELSVCNTKGQFKLTINDPLSNTEYNLWTYGSLWPGSQHPWTKQKVDGQLKLHMYFYPEGLDKAIVGRDARSESDINDAYRLANDLSLGQELAADSSAWINIPSDADVVYVPLLCIKNDVIVQKRIVNVSYLNDNLYTGYTENMQDPNGRDMVKMNLFFRPGVKQGHAALVRASMTDEEVLEAFSKNEIRCLYTPKMTYYTQYARAYLHYPYDEPTRYRIVVIGEMQDGTVQLLHNDEETYRPIEEIVYPQVSLSWNCTPEAMEDGTYRYQLTWNSDFPDAPCAYEIYEIETDENGIEHTTMIQTATLQGTPQYTEPFEPKLGAKYYVRIKLFDSRGDLLMQMNNNPTVLLDDYRVIAHGAYIDYVLFDDMGSIDLEYSASTGLYRWPNLFADGTHFYFRFDGRTMTFCDEEGNPTNYFPTGYVHPNYGMIMCNIITDYEMGYDPTVGQGQFHFVAKFTVSAGSFGTNYQFYNVSEWLEKPWEK